MKGDPGPAAIKIDQTVSWSSGNPPDAALLTIGPWTIGMRCAGAVVDPIAYLDVDGPGNAEYAFMKNENDQPVPLNYQTGDPPLTPGTFAPVEAIQSFSTPNYGRMIGSMILSDGTSVAYVYINLLADARSANSSQWSCSARGFAIPTS